MEPQLPGPTIPSAKARMLPKSVAMLMVRLALLLFIFDTVYALLFVAFWLVHPGSTASIYFIWVLWIAHSIKYLVLFIMAIRLVTTWTSVNFIIHDHYLIVHSRVVGSRDQEFDLRHLRQVEVSQDWLARRFHTGSIDLFFTQSGLSNHVVLSDIAHPRDITLLFRPFL